MISHLSIRGLGVIAAADLEFSSGMVAVTGETGAGKTMLVGALGLVLGDRADTGLVSGDRAQVSAHLIVAAAGDVAERVRDAGGELEPDGTLVVTRTVAASGRGRAAVGGAAAPVSLLADIGARVAQRHSQSDQIRLRSPKRQREALDEYGGADLRAALADYQELYRELTTISRELQVLTGDRAQREQRIALLREGLAAIGAVDPQPDEDVAVARDIARLAHAEQLGTALSGALAALDDDAAPAAAQASLAQAQQSLERAAAVDPALAGFVPRVDEIRVLLGEVVADLRRYTDDLTPDPAKLEELQQRRAALVALQRRFGPAHADVLAWADSARQELDRLDPDPEAESRLRDELAVLVASLGESARRLSAARAVAAERLAEAVTAELAALAMPHARFTVELRQREDAAGLTLPDGRVVAFGGDGADVVRFLLAPHPGSAPAPIGDGASGGELSRIVLALEVVLSESSPPSVFVFDEIDAGIGGSTAVEVGRRLARLADRSQVMVVTHLAQVAAFADQQVVVRKDQSGRVTATTVTEVAGDDRRRELARMLSGQEHSRTALDHAGELLAVAAVAPEVPEGAP